MCKVQATVHTIRHGIQEEEDEKKKALLLLV